MLQKIKRFTASNKSCIHQLDQKRNVIAELDSMVDTSK